MLASLGRVAAQRLAPRRIAASSSGYIVRVGRVAAHQPNGSSGVLGAVFTKRTYVAGRPKKTAAGSTATATATATKAKAKPRKTAAAAAAPTKKAAPKKKITKAKTAASKTKKKPVVRRPKKVLTEEQKVELKLAAQKKLLKEKAKLGSEPKNLPSSPWMVFVQESLTTPSPGERVVAQMPKLGAAFRSLSSTEMQRLEGIAEQNKLHNDAQYKAWVASQTPAQIVEMIKARKLLKSKFDLPKSRKSYARIYDDRLPKRPITPYLHFSRSKFGSGERGEESVIEMQKANAEAWKKMTPSEQQPFKDLAEADKQRYIKEREAAGLR